MNNKEFDQFLKNEVNSINYGGGEFAWQQFTAGAVDEQIKSEVEAIHYPGAEEAWNQFAKEQGIDQSTKRRVIFWRPLAVAASMAILVGVLLNYSNENSTFQNSSELVEVEPNRNSDTEPNSIVETVSIDADSHGELSQNVVAVNAIADRSDEQATEPISAIKPTTNTSYQGESLESFTQANVSALDYAQQKVSVSSPIRNTQQVAVASIDGSKKALLSTIAELPSLDGYQLDYPLLFASIEKELEVQLSKKRRFNVFGEVGIGNQQSGLRLITGVSIPMNSWSVEAGVGLMDKSNRPMYFNQSIESNVFSDFEEFHDYTFIQKVSMIVPVRIKKRIWKRHNIIVGVQGSYNFSNQVDIESVVPHVTPQFGTGINSGIGPDIDYGQEIYKYNNIGSASNAYSVVTSNKANLDITAGYELDLSRFSLGVSVAKPVFSSFKVTESINGPILFNITENPSVNLSLKYRLI